MKLLKFKRQTIISQIENEKQTKVLEVFFFFNFTIILTYFIKHS